MTRFLLTILLFCCTISNGFNQVFKEPQSIRTDIYARFTSFDEYLGKDCGDVVDIEQDKYGYIWLAATNGLFRFDGNQVRKYINDWTPGSLPSSKVFCIEQDAFERLWIGTANGICRFDYDTDSFEPLFTQADSVKASDSLYIREVYADGDSLLWFETLQGYLWKIDQKSLLVEKQYKHWRLNQPYYYYHSIYRDSQGTLYFGGRNIGPYTINDKDQPELLPVSASIPVPGMKRDYDLAWCFEDEYGTVWMGALDGIYQYDPRQSRFHSFMRGSSWAMHAGSDNKLWFGTGNGLASYSLESGEWIDYIPNDDDPYSLPGHYIYKIYEDGYGRIWVSTSGGLRVLIPNTTGVDYLFHISGTNKALASSKITSLGEGADNSLWIGTAGKGIDHLNLENYELTHFNPENTKGLKSGNIRCLTLDKNGIPYCGLWAGIGFGRLDANKKRFSLYTLDKNSTNMDWYNDLEFDLNGNLYVGFWGGYGLSLFDTKKEKHLRFFTQKFHDPHNSRHITCLHLDRQNRLWMGTTRNGLHTYLPEADTSFCYYSKFNPESGFDQKKIYDVNEDELGNIWIGAKGLFVIRSGQEKIVEIELWNPEDRPEVYTILPISQYEIWLLTNKGVYKYNSVSQNYSIYSSIIKLEFKASTSCAIQLSDGRIVMGGENGLAIFHPDELRTTLKTPLVYLSALNVFDEVKIPSLAKHRHVELEHNENFFSIQVGANIWGHEDPFSYYYILEGFNKDWIKLSKSDRLAQFTNVPPGEYVFKVKVAADQGWEYEEPLELDVCIVAPYWMRWWFIAFVVFVIVSVIVIIILYRVRSIKLSLSNSELNQKLLRLQMNPHFIFNSLFAIQNYIYSNRPHEAGNYLSDFASLIRMILDNSRHEYIAFEKEIECIDLYLKMQQLRFEDKFDFTINYDQELFDNDYAVPPMLAQPFLENAIEHGLKALKRKGEIVINYQLKNGMIHFSVVDNGIGLTASKQINTRKNKEHESLAISICQKRLEILNRKKRSKIKFGIKEIIGENNEVKGTSVHFNIPYQN